MIRAADIAPILRPRPVGTFVSTTLPATAPPGGDLVPAPAPEPGVGPPPEAATPSAPRSRSSRSRSRTAAAAAAAETAASTPPSEAGVSIPPSEAGATPTETVAPDKSEARGATKSPATSPRRRTKATSAATAATGTDGSTPAVAPKPPTAKRTSRAPATEPAAQVAAASVTVAAQPADLDATPDVAQAAAVAEPPAVAAVPDAAPAPAAPMTHPPRAATFARARIVVPADGDGAAADAIAPATDGLVRCRACGKPVALAANFCSTCGEPVGEAVALAPAEAARFPVRPVALIATAVGLLALGVTMGAMLFPPAPDEVARASGGPAIVAGPTPAPHHLDLNVVLDETLGRGGDPTSDVPVGAPCTPTGSSFSDIHPGTTIIVADQGGTILARSTLPDGRTSGAGLCRYRTQVSVPEATSYRVGIADRVATEFSFDELTEVGWSADITFVASP
jgi:hypothetical protein